MRPLEYNDRWNYALIPEEMMKAIRRYVERHIPVGEFLQGIIFNDLRKAVAHADNTNVWLIPIYVNYFHNEVPGPLWGSKKAYDNWLAAK